MRRKALGFHLRTVYKRFVMSFLTVLILPILFFVFVFWGCFFQIYQDKIIEQAEDSLYATAMELEREIESLQKIVIYNSQLDYMQDYALKKDFRAKNITDMLRAEVATHSILENIGYYSATGPQKVFCIEGSYSLPYFIRFYVGKDNELQLQNLLENGKGSSWYIWEGHKGSNENQGPELFYVVKTWEEKYWFFQLSQSSLREILSKKGDNTLLLDGEQQIFSVESRKEDKNSAKYYEVTTASPSDSFQIVRMIDSEELFAELKWSKALFFIALIIISLLGSTLVMVLSGYNERPIKDLQSIVREKNHDIPSNMEGFELFRFVLKNMEEQILLVEENRSKNNLLLQMIFGWPGTAEEFIEKRRKTGVFLDAELYGVIIIVCQEKDSTDYSKINLYLKEKMRAGFEFQRVDLDMSSQDVFIVGMRKADADRLEEELLQMNRWFSENLNKELYFYVGEIDETWENVHCSYLSVLDYRTQRDFGKKDRIIYCRLEKEEFEKDLYPEIELSALHEALLDVDMERVNMVTNVLLARLSKYRDYRFFFTSIYYDILNAYYSAQMKLALNTDSTLPEIQFLQIESYEDAVHMINRIKDQFENYVGSVKGRKDNYLVSRVMEFVDENKGDRDLSASMVADYFNISISNLSHQFKQRTNRKISDYITDVKCEYACEMLQTTDWRVREIAEMLGYTHSSTFIRVFKEHYGMTPVEYRTSESTKMGVDEMNGSSEEGRCSGQKKVEGNKR